MGRKSKDHKERINFELKGELALWLQEMKERGLRSIQETMVEILSDYLKNKD